MPIPSSLIDSEVVRKRDDVILGIDDDATYSSLSEDDSDDDHDDVLEPPGLLPIMFPVLLLPAEWPDNWRWAVVAQVRVECGDPDNDIRTRAALHSFIGSEWLLLLLLSIWESS